MQEVDFSDRCAGQTFHRGDSKALEDTGYEQGNIIGADSTPNAADDEADAGSEIYRSLTIENRSG